MIRLVRGTVVARSKDALVVDVGGVGFKVLTPEPTAARFHDGATVLLHTYLQVREDAHILFGFSTTEERDLFRLLVNRVSGVGPKMALAVLSGMDVVRFKAAVVDSDIASLSKINGLGKKTAERIVLELKDKLGVAAAWEAASADNAPSAGARAANDAVLALIALGYRQVEGAKAVREVALKNKEAGTEELVRLALKLLV